MEEKMHPFEKAMLKTFGDYEELWRLREQNKKYEKVMRFLIEELNVSFGSTPQHIQWKEDSYKIETIRSINYIILGGTKIIISEESADMLKPIVIECMKKIHRREPF